MHRHPARLALLGLWLIGSVRCEKQSACSELPTDPRCIPVLELAGPQPHPRCSLQLKAEHITGLAPLSVTANPADSEPLIPPSFRAEPGGEVANTREALAAFAQQQGLGSLDGVWFHFSVPGTWLPEGTYGVFTLHDGERSSAGRRIQLGEPPSSVKLSGAPIQSTRVSPLSLRDNPRIGHIGAADGKILFLRSGPAGGTVNIDRARVVGTKLMSEPFVTAPGSSALHQDLLAAFTPKRIVLLMPWPLGMPEGMEVFNCSAELSSWVSCALASPPLLAPQARALAVSKDGKSGALVDKNGTLSVAALSPMPGVFLNWRTLFQPSRPLSLRDTVWLRFADLDNDQLEDLVLVFQWADGAGSVTALRNLGGIYEFSPTLATRVDTALRSVSIRAMTLGQLSPGSVQLAFVENDTLVIRESQCGRAFETVRSIALGIPPLHDWSSGAIAIDDVTGDGKPDLILGYTTRHMTKDEYLQHLHVYPSS